MCLSGWPDSLCYSLDSISWWLSSELNHSCHVFSFSHLQVPLFLLLSPRLIMFHLGLYLGRRSLGWRFGRCQGFYCLVCLCALSSFDLFECRSCCWMFCCFGLQLLRWCSLICLCRWGRRRLYLFCCLYLRQDCTTLWNLWRRWCPGLQESRLAVLYAQGCWFELNCFTSRSPMWSSTYLLHPSWSYSAFVHI